jgi:DNA-binding beta-propeller fold protein YncE
MHRILIIALLLLLSGCAAGPRPESGPAVYYPPAPAAPRVQFLTQLSNSAQVTNDRSGLDKLLFGEKSLADEIIKPYGVTISEGTVYVCDTKRGMIVLFDLANDRFGYMGTQENGALKKPINIFATPNGMKYVADVDGGCIAVYDRNDAYLHSFGSEKLQKPVDVAVNEDHVFVCDASPCEIIVFDRHSREYLYSFGGKGSAEGRFARPTNIALDGQGHIYVSDTINGRVQKLDLQGRHLQSYGNLGDRPGQFARPKGLDVDAQGRLYIADAAFENIQIFANSGQILLFFAGPGEEAGQLTLPADVTIDTENVEYFRRFAGKGFEIEYLILVTSQYGPHKVNVYGFGHGGRD